MRKWTCKIVSEAEDVESKRHGWVPAVSFVEGVEETEKEQPSGG